jgi:outer membrane lipoprotein-sorting protein
MPHRITRCDKNWSFPSVFTFLVVLSWAFAPLVFAQKDQEKSDETKLVLSALAKRYENLGNWEATFFQTEKSPGFSQEITSEGFFKFVKSKNRNFFILESKNQKIKKRFVSDGLRAIYLEDKGEGKKDRYFARRFDDAKNLELERFLLFFRGLKSKNASEKDYEIKGSFKKPDLEVTLTPKIESDFSEIKISFHNTEKFPSILTFVDSVGGNTSLRIIEAKSITKLDPKWFDLALPSGVKTEK